MKKIQSLNKHMLYLESTRRETQSQSLIVTNTSDLLNLELEKLNKYLRRSCLVVSGVQLQRNKTSEKGRRDKSVGTNGKVNLQSA